MSGIARRFAPDFQKDARAIVVSKRQKHPPSEPEPVQPQGLRVRRASVDKDGVYRPRVAFTAVARDDRDTLDRAEVPACACRKGGVQFNADDLAVRLDNGCDDRGVIPETASM